MSGNDERNELQRAQDVRDARDALAKAKAERRCKCQSFWVIRDGCSCGSEDAVKEAEARLRAAVRAL